MPSRAESPDPSIGMPTEPLGPMRAAIFGRPDWRHWVVSVVLAVATLVVYLPVRHHGFVAYDDADYVTDNAHVQAGLTWTGVKWAFTTGHASNWHPLTWISHMLDAQLFGKGAAGPHATNVLFHLANTLLLFAVLCRYATGAMWRSACVAALFALHPLHVESVAWVAERKDVLSAFFFLLTLWAYANYAAPDLGDSSRGMRWYGVALVLFALGLMSKPMLVTLPCVLLLLDRWPLGRIDGQATRQAPGRIAALIWEKIPFVLISALSCGITYSVQQHGGAVRSLESFSLAERLGNALVSYSRYLAKMLWPADLAVFYPHPGRWPVGELVAAALVVTGGCVIAIIMARRAPFVAVGWFWFLGMLVPTIGLVQVGNQSMADRYTYLPSIGLFVAVAWAAAVAVTRWRIPRTIGFAAGAAVAGACAFATNRQLQHWKNSESLFVRALAVTERNFVAHNGLGYALLGRGRFDEAVAQFRRAVAIHPRFAEAHTNLGSALLQKGDANGAVASFEKALSVLPNFALAHYNLGTLLLQLGRLDEAIVELEKAVALRKDDAIAQVNLGNAFLQRGRLDNAAARYREALNLQPRYADAHNNLGHVALQTGRLDDAIGHFEKAVEIDPGHANAYYNLGDACLRQGRLDDALVAFRRSLEIQPDDAEARNISGVILLQQGHGEEALTQLLAALKIRPEYVQARENLDRLLQFARAKSDNSLAAKISLEAKKLPVSPASER